MHLSFLYHGTSPDAVERLFADGNRLYVFCNTALSLACLGNPDNFENQIATCLLQASGEPNPHLLSEEPLEPAWGMSKEEKEKWRPNRTRAGWGWIKVHQLTMLRPSVMELREWLFPDVSLGALLVRSGINAGLLWKHRRLQFDGVHMHPCLYCSCHDGDGGWVVYQIC